MSDPLRELTTAHGDSLRCGVDNSNLLVEVKDASGNKALIGLSRSDATWLRGQIAEFLLGLVP